MCEYVIGDVCDGWWLEEVDEEDEYGVDESEEADDEYEYDGEFFGVSGFLSCVDESSFLHVLYDEGDDDGFEAYVE